MQRQVNRIDPAPDYSAREAWRLFGIMSEFVEATERLVLDELKLAKDQMKTEKWG